MALDKLLTSDIDVFRKLCRENEHRTTLAYLGLDLIIDREGKIHCLEINGQFSGTKGFEQAYGEDTARKNCINFMASFGLPLIIYTGSQKSETDCWAEEKLGAKVIDYFQLKFDCCKEVMGDRNMSNEEYFQRWYLLSKKEKCILEFMYKYTFMDKLGEDPCIPGDKCLLGMHSPNLAERVVWSNTDSEIIFDERRSLAVNPYLIESVLQNKFKTLALMNQRNDNIAFLHGFSADSLNFLTRYIQKAKGKLVFKPVDGKCGNGVMVFEKKQLLNSEGKLWKELEQMIEEPENYFSSKEDVENFKILRAAEKGIIMQPFFESKPFLSPRSGRHHYGTIRQIVMVYSENSRISVHNMGAYVRLAPEPINGSKRDSYVVNLAAGAEAVPISGADMNKINGWTEKAIPDFYRRALRIDLKTSAANILHFVLIDFKKYNFYEMP